MKKPAATLPGAEHTILRGYGPFAALVALLLAMAFLAPTIAPEREVTTRERPAASAGCGSGPALPDQRAISTDGCRK